MDGIISPERTPSPQDFGQIFKLIGGYRISQALHVTVELGIPDLLSNGPMHSDDFGRTDGNPRPDPLSRSSLFGGGPGFSTR